MVKLPTPSMRHCQHSQRMGESCPHGKGKHSGTRFNYHQAKHPRAQGGTTRYYAILTGTATYCAKGFHCSGTNALLSGVAQPGGYFSYEDL